MKILLAVILYAAMVGALNLGGVVWNNVLGSPVEKAPAKAVASATAPQK